VGITLRFGGDTQAALRSIKARTLILALALAREAAAAIPPIEFRGEQARKTMAH
jgi:hypothetical protein